MAPPRPVRPRFTFETRPSDFIARTSGGLYSAGCCCCCCCLHWLGAAVGLGRIGMRSGFVAAERAGRRPHASMNAPIILGLLLGLVVSGIVLGLLGQWAVLALAPPVLILPGGVLTLLLVKWKGLRLQGTYRRAQKQLAAPAPPLLPQGVFRTATMTTPARTTAPELAGYVSLCPSCRHELDDDVVLECPSCQVPIRTPTFPVLQEGMSLALSTTGRAFLWSTGLSIVAYGVMWLALIVLKL